MTADYSDFPFDDLTTEAIAALMIESVKLNDADFVAACREQLKRRTPGAKPPVAEQTPSFRPPKFTPPGDDWVVLPATAAMMALLHDASGRPTCTFYEAAYAADRLASAVFVTLECVLTGDTGENWLATGRLAAKLRALAQFLDPTTREGARAYLARRAGAPAPRRTLQTASQAPDDDLLDEEIDAFLGDLQRVIRASVPAPFAFDFVAGMDTLPFTGEALRRWRKDTPADPANLSLTDIPGVLPRWQLLEVESWSGFPYFVVDTEHPSYDATFPWTGSVGGGFPSREGARQWAVANCERAPTITDAP